MTEIWAALLGAIFAGLFQTLILIRNDKRERDSILQAITAEVSSLCQIIRIQRYLEVHRDLCKNILDGSWDGKVWVIDIRSHYFSVFEALSPRLGLVQPEKSSKIVLFYVLCKAVVDSVRPDGPGATEEDLANKANGVFVIVNILDRLLKLGDEIVQFAPKPLSAINVS